MVIALVVLIGLVVPGIVFLVLRNAVIRSENLVESALADIDVNLLKRHQLIPQLVSLAKQHVAYERELLVDVVNNLVTRGLEELQKIDAADSKTVASIHITAEDYPDLKADQQFKKLMEDIRLAEDDIRFSRQFCNGTIREYNKRIQSFPTNIVAGIMKKQSKPFFTTEGTQIPSIQL